jgi:hypothetical protein
VRLFATLLLAAIGVSGVRAVAQEGAGAAPAAQKPKSEPKYTDTFSGPIVELSTTKITVSRSILGKPAEKRTFWIKPDTRVEGKLHVKVRVTVGFVTTDDGDIARLIVVRAAQKTSQDKK